MTDDSRWPLPSDSDEFLREIAVHGASLVETLAAIERDTPLSPRAVRPELRVSLKQVIYRYQGARELVGAIEAKDSRKAPGRGAASIAALLGLGALSVAGGGGGRRRAPGTRSPRSTRSSRACSLAVKGVGAPGGWLAAAAGRRRLRTCRHGALGERPP